MQFKTMEQLERYSAGGGGINWDSYFGKLFGISTKAKHTVYPMVHQFYYWVYTKKNECLCLPKDMFKNVRNRFIQNG